MRSVVGTVTDAGPVRRELEENAGEAEIAAPTRGLTLLCRALKW